MKRCVCPIPIHCIYDIAALNLLACAQILFVLTKTAAVQSNKGQFVPLCRAVCTYLGSSGILGKTYPMGVGTAQGTAMCQHAVWTSEAKEGDVRCLSITGEAAA